MRKAMNSIWLSKAALCAGLLLCGPATAAPMQVDRIVAVVNSGVITEIELNRRVDQVLRQMAAQRTPAPPRRQLTRQVLERMITETALMQIAEDSNIRFDGPVLDRAIARIAQNNNLSPEAFRKALEADGVDFGAFREQIRAEMTLSRLREREAENKVVVTEAEIDNFLAGQAQSEQRNEYRLAHILILTPEGASPEKLGELRAKAAAALAELRAGADFAQVAAAYSDAQNALQGGVLGWRDEGQLPELFLRELVKLKVGEVSDILRGGNGFHLFKLLDKRGRDARTVVRQTRARHILVKTSEIVGDAEARNRLLQLKERIEHGGDFAALARQHSDDLSASRGGELNWLNPGDTVPQFERAMDALRLGEVSEPVRSPFGWHLIQVQERRDQDVTEERRRLEARRVIRERKTEEAFEDWVRQARDRAYVEHRLDE